MSTDSGQQTPTNEGSLYDKEGKSESLNNDVINQQAPKQLDYQPLDEKPLSKQISVCIFCFLVAWGGFIFGYDTGTISGFVNMTNFIHRFGQVTPHGREYLSNVRMGLIVSIFNIGCIIGAIFLSRLADIYGRRIGLMISMLIYVVGIIIQIASIDKWYQYFIGRLVSGVAVGIVTVLCPLFIGESAPKKLRGTLVYCFQLCVTFGIFLGYCICYKTKSYDDDRQWRVPLGLCFAWALMLIAGMLAMPESPRYLIQKDRIDDAIRSLAKSNKTDPNDKAVIAEIELIQAGIDRERMAGSASWKELFTGKPQIFRRLVMGTIVFSIQQLTGDNYFFYYGTTIFKAVGMDDSFEASIVFGVVNFASTFVGIYVIERFGRRKCLITGSVVMFLCFIVYAVLGSVDLYIDGYDGPTRKPTGDAMIFVTCLYILFFASTWAGGTFCVVSETYPLRIRSKAMALASAANWIWGFLISFFTPFITSAIHFYYGFVFAGCLLFSAFFVYFFVCETKGLSLEEVDQMYSEGVLPWKSSSWVPPRLNVEDDPRFSSDGKPQVETA